MKRIIEKCVPPHVRFIFLSLALLMSVNFVFRSALFFLNVDLTADAGNSDIFYCFFNRGLLFDIYISLIILLIPYILGSIPFVMNKSNKRLFVISNWTIITLAIVNISIASADLGFFRYYNSRITNAIFDWTDDIGLMLKIMTNDSTYLPFFLVFIIVTVLYVYLQSKILKKSLAQPAVHFNIVTRLTMFLGLLVLIFFGIRGSFDFSRMPLNADDAYFSDNPFLNQLSFNPVYSLAHSYTDTKINYFKNDENAVDAALQYLNRKKGNAVNPFEIKMTGSDSTKPNVVVILLESMSNAMVSRYNPGHGTTPFLDSLADNGIVFDNFFAAGIHTYNGIFSSFYGLPAIMHNKPLNSVQTANMEFYGLPWILKEKGYRTFFYVTGAKEFDNMNGFLLHNGFDGIIGESDYPPDSIFDGWGVTDKIMFNRVLNDCDSMHRSGTNFFIGVLTITSHVGYSVPTSYKNKLTNKEYPFSLYEYADRLLEEFMGLASNRDWFKNTVFVFVGDHGQNFSAVYDLNLNYHRVPLIIYSPEYFNHIEYKGPSLQQDIYPTLCGLLNMGYVNNGLGVDLFKHKRKYAYFSADNKLGIIDNKHFLIYRGENNVSMYDFKNNPLNDIYFENTIKADSMQSYGFSMLQSAQYLIENRLTNNVDITEP